MKTKIITFAVLLFACFSLRAQTFSGPLTVTGTTNASMYISGVIPTNSSTFYVPQKPVTISNINTNETAIISYGAIISGQGYTNYVKINVLTLTFPAPTYTNGSSMTTNVAAQQLTVSVIPYAQAEIGNYTNGIQAP